MSDATNQAAIIKAVERFNDLSKYKREPVGKFPLEPDLIPGLEWREDGGKAAECVNLYLINSFFTLIKAPNSLPGSPNNTRSQFTEKTIRN